MYIKRIKKKHRKTKRNHLIMCPICVRYINFIYNLNQKINLVEGKQTYYSSRAYTGISAL